MMLNLSRLTFSPSQPQTFKIIGNPYELHRFVYATMSAKGNTGRLLYRLEAGYGLRNPQPLVLIQTEHPVLPQIDVGWGGADFVRVETKSCAVKLGAGALYRFRARVNPVRSKLPLEDRARGKRMGISEAENQIGWFEKKLKNSGMSLCMMDHRRESWVEIKKPKQLSHGRLKFASAFFDGTLRIIDTELAEKAVLQGIGPGKGFGFGLISLARV